MKTCTKCKESKELVCFYKNISKSDGFCIHCKSCIAERKRKYNQANAEKIAERGRKYYQVKKQEEAANLFFQMAHFASEITKTTITP
jgi:hypothetical protein